MSKYFLFGKRVTEKAFIDRLVEYETKYNVYIRGSIFDLNSYCYYFEHEKGKYLVSKHRCVHFGTVHIS